MLECRSFSHGGTASTVSSDFHINFVMKLRSWPLAVLLALFVAMVVIAHLCAVKAGWADFRDQHLGAAITYARGSIELFKPVMTGFTATQTPSPQEFPIWQTLAALAMKAFGPWWGWANVVSLLCFFSALWPLYRLALAYGNERRAWWTLIFFSAQPLNILYAGCAGTDGFSISMAIWFLYFAHRTIRDGRPLDIAAATLFGIVAAISKLPFFMAAGIASFILLLAEQPRNTVRWLQLAGIGAISGAVFFGWSHYCDTQYALAEFPLVELRTSVNPYMRFWYFGDWHYRLTPGNWLKGGWRFIRILFGSTGFAGLLIAGILIRKHTLAIAGLIGGFVTTLVFSHLVLHHSHYYLMFSASVAMLSAEAVTKLEETIPWRSFRWTFAGPMIAAIVLPLASIQGMLDSDFLLFGDPYKHTIAHLLQEHTVPADKLIIAGGGWGGESLIMSDRLGLSVFDTALLENPATLHRLKELGYNKLVAINESPLFAAIEKTKPGGASRLRGSYDSELTPVTENWSVLFKNEDIIIKAIP